MYLILFSIPYFLVAILAFMIQNTPVVCWILVSANVLFASGFVVMTINQGNKKKNEKEKPLTK